MSLLTEIIDWIENKPLFWQEAVNRIIRDKNLSQTDIEELVEICKYENNISDYEYDAIDIDELKELVSDFDAQENITLVNIKDIENINALLGGETELSFNATGLSVIYGDNGSGKSSYVSILKNICNTRGSQPKINFNLFDDESDEKRQIAKVKYLKEDGTSGFVTWEDHKIDDTILKAVDVFDSSSANHYIDGEDEIAFTPLGLTVLEKLAQACNQVEEIINSEKQNSDRSAFNSAFLLDDVETEVSTFLRTLSSESKQEDLDRLAIHTDENEEKINELAEKIAKLKLTDPVKTISDNTQKIRRFNSLKVKYQSLENNFSKESLDSIKTIVNNLLEASEASKLVSEKAFSNLPMEGVGNGQWKRLWESARKFYDEVHGEGTFPNAHEAESCPLCLQPLGEDAQKRFLNFEEFVKADLQEQLNEASEIFKNRQDYYKGLSFDLTDSEPTIEEIKELDSNFEVIKDSFITVLQDNNSSISNIFDDPKKIDSIELPKPEKSPIIIIEGLVERLEKENETLMELSIEKELETLQKEHARLISIKNITTHKPQIEKEIERLKLISGLRKCASQCNPRNITILSNNLTGTYVTTTLQENFKAELRKLGFKNIEVNAGTKGARGRQYHSLQLDISYGVSIHLKDILSEGEHRCISLATFLSELSISEHKSAIIFDDPVSSLDHKWRKKISRRIVEESKERQVIVFTHDITFLMMLQEEADSLSSDIDIKSLTRKRTETGIPALRPPWDAVPVSKRIGLLKDFYQRLEKMERTETQEVYDESVKVFYGRLRETWERLVEELVLNNTVQRFGRAIQTQRLKKIVDFSDDDYKIIEDNMSKCSTYFLGHDSAGALIESMPNSDEVDGDIKIIDDYSKELRKRR